LAQAAGFDQGASNAQAAINASSIASGALATISDDAQKLYTLSVAGNNDLLSASDRANLQTEANQVTQQMNATASVMVLGSSTQVRARRLRSTAS
jgi:flagellin